VTGSPPAAAPRILLVRFSSIGDILLTTPLLRVLRVRHPAAEITFVTKDAYAPLLRNNPHLTALVTLQPGEPLRELARSLRRRRFTHRLDLHGSVRSRLLRFLLPGRWTGYGKRGLARAVLIRTKRNWYPDQIPVAERYFEAARSLHVAPDGGPAELFLAPAALERVEAWLAEKRLAQRRPLIALAPGAAHATKRWPEPKWVELLRLIGDNGYDAVLVGGSLDVELCRRVSGAAPGPWASAAGAFDLQETGALLKRAKALVSGDTGVMHMATAVGTGVAALFGPTVGAFGFFPYRAASVVVERDLPCRPCSSQGGPACPLGHHRCLADITALDVASALDRLPA
jgi:lipopolysaccharide heptosyltransferase II